MHMRFGDFHLFEAPVGIKEQNQVYREAMDQIGCAEELGFHRTWLAEHHFSDYGICPSTLVLAAAVATATRRIRIGLAIVVLPFNHPIRVAEEAAMVDVLSGGRLDFGVGRGYQKPEFDGFGISMDESRGRFNESMDIIVKAWTQDSFSHSGVYYQVKDLTTFPKPVQKPHPPVFVATIATPASVEYAARQGFSILSPGRALGAHGQPHQELPVDLPALFRAACQKCGRDFSQVELPIIRHIYVAETTAAAEREARDAIMRYFMTFGRQTVEIRTQDVSKQYEYYRQPPTEVTYEQLLKGALIFGDPDYVTAKIRQQQEKEGFNSLICWLNFGGLDHQKVLKSMDLFAKQVMPRFGA